MTFPEANRTKEEYVYDTLHIAIIRCELAPGQKLVIDSLSEKLGVSPIPVRSPLQRLQAEGLVLITLHTGTHVSEISLETVNEIFMLLESLETIAFSVTAVKATDNDILHLQHLVTEMAAALNAGDTGYWYDLNNQFHLTIVRTTNMKMLRILSITSG